MANKKIIETNRHLNTPEKRINRISKSVHASQRIEGVKISRKDAKKYTKEASKNGGTRSGFVYRKNSKDSSQFVDGKSSPSSRG